MVNEHPEGPKGVSFRGFSGWQAATCGLLGTLKMAEEGNKDGGRETPEAAPFVCLNT